MPMRLVTLYTWVVDPPGGGGGPVDPGFGVPGWPNQDPPGNQPGIWGPNDPRPSNPIVLPPGYPGSGGGGQPPLGIWGPTDPRPSNPIYWPGFPGGGGGGGGGGQPPVIWPGPNPPYIDAGFPGPQPPYPPYVDIGFPGNQPYPDQSLPGNQPGIWPGRPPYIDIGFPGPQPGGPVYIDNTLPITPGLRPMPPVYSPGPPSLDPENLPEHPEVPDLNTGRWGWIQDPQTRQSVLAFVTYPLVVTHPDYNPQYPPEETQPGTWVITMANYRMTWAWIPEKPEPNRDLPGAQPKKAAAAKAE